MFRLRENDRFDTDHYDTTPGGDKDAVLRFDNINGAWTLDGPYFAGYVMPERVAAEFCGASGDDRACVLHELIAEEVP